MLGIWHIISNSAGFVLNFCWKNSQNMIAHLIQGLAPFSLLTQQTLFIFVDFRQNFKSKPHEFQFEIELCLQLLRLLSF